MKYISDCDMSGGGRDRVKVLLGAWVFLTLSHEGIAFELDKKGEKDCGGEVKKGRVF